MADYLSRHHTELEGASIKAETLWNEWFTVNSVISLNNVLENNDSTEQVESVKCANENNTVNRINQRKRSSQSENGTSAFLGKQVRSIVELPRELER